MNEKNEINPKRAFIALGIVMILVVGGIFLGRHIMEGNDNSEVTASTTETAAPSPETGNDAKDDYKFEIIEDGIVGIEPGAEPSAAPETESGTPETVAPAGTPAANTNTAPAATTPAPATGSTGGGTVTTPVSTQTPSAETTTAPVTTTPTPAAQTPADGSTNSEGQVYVPGFGWYAPTGGVSEPSHGNGGGTEQVGTMG